MLLKIKKNRILQWLVLSILLIIFFGMMWGMLHFDQDQFLKIDTSQIRIRKDTDELLEKHRNSFITKVPYNLAYDSFLKENFILSKIQLLPYALTGNSNACLVIGFLSEFGQGVKKNYKKAALWYYVGLRLNKFNREIFLHGIHEYNREDYASAAASLRMANELTILRDQYE